MGHHRSGSEATRDEGLWLCLPVRALPVQVSELTPAWLSGVLDLDVVDVTVLDHASATNQRLRLGLSYPPAVEGPASLFVKLASQDAAHREMIGASTMGEREARFYVDVAPAVDLRVPRAYFAASADDGSFALLLEDLAAGGCAFSDGSWGVTADAAATAWRSWPASTPHSKIRPSVQRLPPGWPRRSRSTATSSPS